MKSATVAQSDASLPAGDTAERRRRPPSYEATVAEVRRRLGEDWPPRIYRERVLPMRTRSHAVPTSTKRDAPVEILHTLLGIELKAGRRRMSCPDLATARYLAVFARAGLAEVAVPYDITKISHLADELEAAWQRMLLLVEHLTEGRSPAARTRARAAAVKAARAEIAEAGAGTPVPQFRQETRQRPRRI
jgi:hypothetical protein